MQGCASSKAVNYNLFGTLLVQPLLILERHGISQQHTFSLDWDHVALPTLRRCQRHAVRKGVQTACRARVSKRRRLRGEARSRAELRRPRRQPWLRCPSSPALQGLALRRASRSQDPRPLPVSRARYWLPASLHPARRHIFVDSELQLTFRRLLGLERLALSLKDGGAVAPAGLRQ